MQRKQLCRRWHASFHARTTVCYGGGSYSPPQDHVRGTACNHLSCRNYSDTTSSDPRHTCSASDRPQHRAFGDFTFWLSLADLTKSVHFGLITYLDQSSLNFGLST